MTTIADLFPHHREVITSAVAILGGISLLALILYGMVRARNTAHRNRVAEILKEHAEALALRAGSVKEGDEVKAMVNQLTLEIRREARASKLSGLAYFILGIAAPIALKAIFGIG